MLEKIVKVLKVVVSKDQNWATRKVYLGLRIPINCKTSYYLTLTQMRIYHLNFWENVNRGHL